MDGDALGAKVPAADVAGHRHSKHEQSNIMAWYHLGLVTFRPHAISQLVWTVDHYSWYHFQDHMG